MTAKKNLVSTAILQGGYFRALVHFNAYIKAMNLQINKKSETTENIKKKEIHANHIEASNASIRRRNSAYRRETNTYAKSTDGLQRTLDLFWVMHNFVRVHFTTKEVPAVKLSLIEKGFTLEDILKIKIAV